MSPSREALLGIPEEVQKAVDDDLFAATRGPAALTLRLDGADLADVTARYRALLGRETHTQAMAPRIARDRTRHAAEADERARLLQRSTR